jgi:hypothetical protein
MPDIYFSVHRSIPSCNAQSQCRFNTDPISDFYLGHRSIDMLVQKLAELAATLAGKLRSANWGHSPPSSTPTQPELPGFYAIF